MIGVSIRSQIAEWLRLATPTLVSLLLLFISIAPWRPFDAPLAGSLVGGAIFYWTIYQPEAMTPWVAALVGLASDILGLSPFGLSMLLALVICGSAQFWRQQLAEASFIVVWLAFAATSLLTFFVGWALAALILEQWPDPWPIALQGIVNVALYPVLTLLCGRLQRALFE
ncbi:MAG TPA: rod shape-determining protein MreD [Dongiaceae bacterium]